MTILLFILTCVLIVFGIFNNMNNPHHNDWKHGIEQLNNKMSRDKTIRMIRNVDERYIVDAEFEEIK